MSQEAIYGGRAESGYPSVGQIAVQTANGQGFCTGTLIRPNIVITAAHCVLDANGRKLDIKRMDFRLGPSSQPTQSFRVVAFVAHPNYKNLEASADIALLRLAGGAQGVTPAVISSMSEAN